MVLPLRVNGLDNNGSEKIHGISQTSRIRILPSDGVVPYE